MEELFGKEAHDLMVVPKLAICPAYVCYYILDDCIIPWPWNNWCRLTVHLQNNCGSTFHNGSFDEFYNRLIFIYYQKKNSCIERSMLSYNITLPWFDEFFLLYVNLKQ